MVRKSERINFRFSPDERELLDSLVLRENSNERGLYPWGDVTRTSLVLALLRRHKEALNARAELRAKDEAEKTAREIKAKKRRVKK